MMFDGPQVMTTCEYTDTARTPEGSIVVVVGSIVGPCYESRAGCLRLVCDSVDYTPPLLLRGLLVTQTMGTCRAPLACYGLSCLPKACRDRTTSLLRRLLSLTLGWGQC